ncbi:MAG: hypothetical protein WDM76_04305 [Limisphaerales bacterium]
MPWLNRRYIVVYVNGPAARFAHGRRANAGQRCGGGKFSGGRRWLALQDAALV